MYKISVYCNSLPSFVPVQLGRPPAVFLARKQRGILHVLLFFLVRRLLRSWHQLTARTAARGAPQLSTQSFEVQSHHHSI